MGPTGDWIRFITKGCSELARLDRASRFVPQQETFFNSSFCGLDWKSLSSFIGTSPIGVDYQFAEKVIFRRLLKNVPAFAEAASRRQADAS
jgi:hypothetical protein